MVLYDDSFYVALRSLPAGRSVVGVLQRHDGRGQQAGAGVQLGRFDQVEGGAWRVSIGPKERKLGLVATSLDAIALLWTARAFLAALVS